MTDEKYQTVEEDKEYAQCIASVLNELIDQNVLTAHAVSTADDESFSEFAMRFRREIVSTLTHPKDLSSFDPDKLKKISRIFSSPAAEAQNPSREEAVALARSILTDMQERCPFIEGLFVYGSRVDPKKTPGQDSDLDIMFILEDRPVNEAIDFTFLRKYSPVVNPATLSESEFTQQRSTAVSSKHKGLNFWEYFPRAVYYIGKLGTMNEAEANFFIHERLTYQETLELKRARLESIKSFIKT